MLSDNWDMPNFLILGWFLPSAPERSDETKTEKSNMINKKIKAQELVRGLWVTLNKFTYTGPIDYNFKIFLKSGLYMLSQNYSW